MKALTLFDVAKNEQSSGLAGPLFTVHLTAYSALMSYAASASLC